MNLRRNFAKLFSKGNVSEEICIPVFYTDFYNFANLRYLTLRNYLPKGTDLGRFLDGFLAFFYDFENLRNLTLRNYLPKGMYLSRFLKFFSCIFFFEL